MNKRVFGIMISTIVTAVACIACAFLLWLFVNVCATA